VEKESLKSFLKRNFASRFSSSINQLVRFSNPLFHLLAKRTEESAPRLNFFPLYFPTAKGTGFSPINQQKILKSTLFPFSMTEIPNSGTLKLYGFLQNLEDGPKKLLFLRKRES